MYKNVLIAVLCAFVLGACSSPDLTKTLLAGAPPVPPGFARVDEAKKAVIGGKVKLLSPPKEYPATITVTKDIEYGRVGDTPLLLDLYAPKTQSKPAPGLIFIHGGGWKKGDKADYAVYTVDYAKKGYVVASINYRMVSEALFPAAVEDAKCAVRWMRAHAEQYNIDPKRIVVLGGSAGGHLSMMVGYTERGEFEGTGGWAQEDSGVQAVVNFYGVPDLTGPLAGASPECTGFIGKPQSEAREVYAQASPLTHLTRDDPPTLSFHGTIDELVPVAETEKLHARLTELKIPNAFDKVVGWPHTMDLAADINAHCQYVLDRFLARYAPVPN